MRWPLGLNAPSPVPIDQIPHGIWFAFHLHNSRRIFEVVVAGEQIKNDLANHPPGANRSQKSFGRLWFVEMNIEHRDSLSGASDTFP